MLLSLEKKVLQDAKTASAQHGLTHASQKLNSGSLDSNETSKLQSGKDRLTVLAKKGVGFDFDFIIDSAVELAPNVAKIDNSN